MRTAHRAGDQSGKADKLADPRFPIVRTLTCRFFVRCAMPEDPSSVHGSQRCLGYRRWSWFRISGYVSFQNVVRSLVTCTGR